MNLAEQLIRQQINERGAITFAEFMEMALYGPEGYYTGENLAIGAGGDYATASTVSPLFGRTTARLLTRLDPHLRRPAELFEAGPGTGAHLHALLSALDRRDERRLRAWDRTPRRLPERVEGVGALADVGEEEIEGLVFSSELFDAQPIHRMIGRAGEEPGELWVSIDERGALTWQEGELSDPSLKGLLSVQGATLAPGQIADLSPQWGRLYRQLARRLGRGLLVTCDYGFEAPKLLDPRIRFHGTLACYHRHRLHRDPFAHVGEQDLTAHVDFSMLIAAGEEAGLDTVALTRQARWLTASGLFEDLRGAQLRTREEAMALLDPDGMGEEIRVLVQSRGIRVSEVLDLEVLGEASASRQPP